MCGVGSDGLQAGVCPGDAQSQQNYDAVNSVEGYTELSDLDEKLISENRTISVRSQQGWDNGEFRVSALNDRTSVAIIGDLPGNVVGVDANGNETSTMSGVLERFVHEVIGHGGQWTELGSYGMIDLVNTRSKIGENETGIDPEQSSYEAYAMQAENRFRAATNNDFRRTHHGSSALTVTETRRQPYV